VIKFYRTLAGTGALILLSGLNAGAAENIARAPRPLTHADYDGWKSIRTQVLSENGKWVAYVYTEGTSTKMTRIAVVPALGGAPKQLFALPGDTEGLRWAPTGKGVEYLLTRKGATNVWEQMLTGGEPRQLTSFTAGRIVDFSWTRDGKTLLLAKGDLARDVVVIMSTP